MRSGERYQIALIALGAIVALMYAAFLYREVFPEYRIYQQDYMELEKFRSSYTKEPPPPFEQGIKQIVIEREDRGSPTIDRCTSCHVALQFAHFSPTKIVKNENGEVLYNAQGFPVQVPNEEYIWKKLDEEVDRLTNLEENAKLNSEGKTSEVAARLKKADALSSLKRVRADDHIYDVTKVLAMHPLIGKETRPFEFHPVEEYGCTSCHNGNGRGLTTEKAHGPVLDEQYEPEFMGPKPQFLESDPDNDPHFAHMFNEKPGHKLLFQTTPLFMGSLTQAKCLQCHAVNKAVLQPSDKQPIEQPTKGNIDHLTETYIEGRDLYISQACYACHRITGFARGGVGPELTKIGNSYPWYIKESIVWPQADLRSSTMPNFMLDHEELEALMTFLLAQKGDTKAIAETTKIISNQAWESGQKKSDWEKPITPSQMQDLRFAMTVFATEGCAACHRLKGFESNTGFAVEKNQNQPTFEDLYKEQQWFEKLFPEDIRGTEIVKAIDKNKEEIDKRIADDVREGALLDEIQHKYPDQIEALYSPFKFAMRAKDKEFADRLSKTIAPTDKNALQIEYKQWKAIVNKVRMIFIQQYGLGRLICPKPNWSGIYRSDEWLMEHFKNPSAHVPHSIMPVFPFDDTKFYALTHMLDVLSIKNRDAVRKIWQNNGFNPEQAFQIHCSQCHGADRTGDGPVAEWLYPIPKNLRNADFLRNLTKEQAIQSITHGVKGTPMPPWGEVARGKPENKDIPVLSRAEIVKLVNWLFSYLPGGQVIRESADVPKWNYTPEDVLKELHREGNVLQEESPKKLNDPLSMNGKQEMFIAYADPLPMVKSDASKQVDNVFEVVDNTELGRSAYFIKKKFYTDDNIAAGKKFFEINCAVCHGKEADGAGQRAGFMQEAKPRMLTNLDWINTRDDLRLIQSIKFGVPGTAMTPWGDLTSSLQRLQLVMFIRSLTEDRKRHEELTSALYQVFNTALVKIDQARLKEYSRLEKADAEYQKLKRERIELEQAGKRDEATKVYQKELEAIAQLQEDKNRDNLFVEWRKLVEKELMIYQNLGMNIIAKENSENLFRVFLKLVLMNNNRYVVDEKGNLKLMPQNMSEQSDVVQKLIKAFEEKIAVLEGQKKIAEGRLSSKERSSELQQLNADIKSFTAMKDKIISDLKEVEKIEEKQQAISNAI